MSIYLLIICFLIPLALQVHSMSVVKVQDVTLMVLKKTNKKTKSFYFGYIIRLVSSAYCKARTGNLLVSYLHTAI